MNRRVAWIELFKLVSGESISIPLVSIGEGRPRTLVVGPVHGNESSTIYIMWRLMEYLESNITRGRVDFLIGPNYTGLLFGSRNEPLSNININRVYPGEPSLGLGRAVAKKVFEVCMKGYDFVVDLHAAGNSIPHIITDELGDPDTSDIESEVYDLAVKTGITVVVDSQSTPDIKVENISNSLPPLLIKNGVKSFTYEVPGPEYLDDELASLSTEGLINLFIINGHIDEPMRKIDPFFKGGKLYRRLLWSKHPGFIEVYKYPGDLFKEYEDIAVVKDFIGNVNERIRYKGVGIVISIIKMGVVRPFGYVASVGVRE